VDGFQRYLRAKRTVDDRSLDRRLLDRLRDGLDGRAAGRDGPLRVLEVGAGIGTMVERSLEWNLLPKSDVVYTAVDIEAANVETLARRLPEWAAERPVEARREGPVVELDGPERTVTVEPVGADAERFVAERDGEWDLLVGMALLDVLGMDALGTLLSGLAPGGWWYFPITFDGGTRFAPDHSDDDAVERHYHRHVDEKPGGDSRAGHHALGRLQAMDAVSVAGVAGSDWVVYPRDGEYSADEAYVLEYILDTVETAVGDLDRRTLDDETLGEWLATRREQLARAELTYVTHQLDLLGRSAVPSA